MKAIDPLLVELAIIVPLVGALLVGRTADSVAARKRSVAITSVSLALVLAAWLPFDSLTGTEGVSNVSILLTGRSLFAVDNFNAPLLSLVAWIYLVTITTTVPAKLSRFSFSRALASEAITLATFSSHEPWLLIFWLALGAFLPYGEFKWRRQSARVYAIHMLSAIVLLVLGQALTAADGGGSASIAASASLLLGVLLRSGIAPAHCWVTDLFERTSFGSATLFTLPMTGAYAAAILLLPTAASWVGRTLGVIALLSSVYAAGMTLIQRDTRRFYSFLILSQTALVLAGISMTSATGLTGGLCVWLSTGLTLSGLGLVLRAMEVRVGPLSLAQYHGLYDRTPLFGAFFLFAGLATVGFPGTCGFLGSEMLFDGALTTGVFAGVAVVVAGALSGIAIVQAYFKIFTGARCQGTIALRRRPRERFAIVALALLILGIGLFPNPFILSRYQVAEELLDKQDSAAVKLPGKRKRFHVSHKLHRVDDTLFNAQAAVFHAAERRKL